VHNSVAQNNHTFSEEFLLHENFAKYFLRRAITAKVLFYQLPHCATSFFLQGGVMNRGPPFEGPSPLPLGGSEQKDQ
jgi:hypothetical protein